MAGALRGIPRSIQTRRIGHYSKADPAYGVGLVAPSKICLKGPDA